uniref:SUEL-type lectin domain-containing protein n=1 Tax=Clytia hemisphaerica TaxID=252671 RepID=A0A7M5XCX9_9CNID
MKKMTKRLLTFLLILVLSISIFDAQECKVQFERKGCIKTNRVVYHTQIANNRDSHSVVFTGKQVNWGNYQKSLQELIGECANRASKHGIAFAVGDYNQCWIATDEQNYNISFENQWQKSDGCIGHDFTKCVSSKHNLCAGGIGSQYVYFIGHQQNQTVDGKWGNWTSFTKCSKSCGVGFQTRSRICNKPKCGGKSCQGFSTESQQCNVQDCPVDGKWGNWTSYGPCTKSCGGGFQIRSRACDNPPQKYGGKDCLGRATENRTCNSQNCPVNGRYGNWTSFRSCTKSCGGGSQSRSRSCNNPAPKYGGKACVGSATDSRACNTQNCPINGKWGSWSGYGSCNKKCGTGSQTRTRSCNNPSPKYNGASCSGSSQQSRNCNTHSCYSGYMEFKTCEGSSRNVDCGSGKVIKLQDYFWGRTSKSYCRSGVDWFWSTSCRGGHGRIANRCHNRQSCKLEANNSWMNDDPCWGTPKYAWVKYRCYQSPY